MKASRKELSAWRKAIPSGNLLAQVQQGGNWREVTALAQTHGILWVTVKPAGKFIAYAIRCYGPGEAQGHFDR